MKEMQVSLFERHVKEKDLNEVNINVTQHIHQHNLYVSRRTMAPS